MADTPLTPPTKPDAFDAIMDRLRGMATEAEDLAKQILDEARTTSRPLVHQAMRTATASLRSIPAVLASALAAEESERVQVEKQAAAASPDAPAITPAPLGPAATTDAAPGAAQAAAVPAAAQPGVIAPGPASPPVPATPATNVTAPNGSAPKEGG